MTPTAVEPTPGLPTVTEMLKQGLIEVKRMRKEQIQAREQAQQQLNDAMQALDELRDAEHEIRRTANRLGIKLGE